MKISEFSFTQIVSSGSCNKYLVGTCFPFKTRTLRNKTIEESLYFLINGVGKTYDLLTFYLQNSVD